jgi:membrane protein required for colicin V production
VQSAATLDLVLLAIVALSGLVGVWRGFVREALSIAVWVVAVGVAWRYGALLAPQLSEFIDNAVLRVWAARAVVLVGTVLVGSILALLVAQLLHATGLSAADRAVGLVFGVARGVLLGALAVLSMQLVGLDTKPWWRQSKLVPYAAPVTDALRDAAQRSLQRLQRGSLALPPRAGGPVQRG